MASTVSAIPTFGTYRIYKTLIITIIIIIISGLALAGSLEQANTTTRFYHI